MSQAELAWFSKPGVFDTGPSYLAGNGSLVGQFAPDYNGHFFDCTGLRRPYRERLLLLCFLLMGSRLLTPEVAGICQRGHLPSCTGPLLRRRRLRCWPHRYRSLSTYQRCQGPSSANALATPRAMRDLYTNDSHRARPSEKGKERMAEHGVLEVAGSPSRAHHKLAATTARELYHQFRPGPSFQQTLAGHTTLLPVCIKAFFFPLRDPRTVTPPQRIG